MFGKGELITMIVLHIPYFRLEKHKLVKVDYFPYQHAMISGLKSLGVSFKLDKRIVTVNNIKFQEGMCICNCDERTKASVISLYIKLLKKYHRVFKHVFYVYEIDNFSHSISFDSKGDLIHL